MRTGTALIAALSALAMAACTRDASTTIHDDLAKDLARAASSDGFALAPTAGSTKTTVSSVERIALPASRSGRSERASIYHHASHRTTEIAAVTKNEDAADVGMIDVAAPAPEVAAAPAPAGVTVPRPHGVDGSAPSSSPDGIGDQPGVGTGGMIGAVVGAILRGGTADGDHCDPRSDRYPARRPGGSIQQPTHQGTVIRGVMY